MPNKRRPSLSAEQLAFSFATPVAPSAAGDLAELRQIMASSVSQMLADPRGRPRDREAIADEMSRLLGERITKRSLDAYAAESMSDNNMSGYRWMTLVAVTGRYDVLDAVITRIGARALDGDEMATAQLGHLHAQRALIDEEIRALRPQAKPFRRHRG